MKISFLKAGEKNPMKTLVSAFLVTTILFSSAMFAVQANATAVSLTATVATSLTFSISSNQFGTVTPGTPAWATSTLDVLTNDTAGWNVSLTGDNKSTGNNNLQLSGNAASIQDQNEWVPGSATTTTGNGVLIGSLANSGNVLGFRVMTASSSNGTAFAASSWWGTNDLAANAKYAGIASSTAANTKIGNAGTGSYSSSDHLNTVQYYLNVSSAQQTGAYTAPLTYTAVGN